MNHREEAAAHHRRPGRLLVLTLVLAAGLAGSWAAEPEGGASEQARAPQTWAVLINGGSSATKNFLSHFHHLQDMAAALRGRGIPADRIAVFSADGEDPGTDLMGRAAAPPDFWLVEGTPAGRSLNPSELKNSVWEGMTLRPARLRELRKWFAGMSDTLQAGDTLLIFVTDHGTRNADDPDNGFISLWNETLSVLEFRALLGYVPPGVRIVNVMSQCYSGAFADAMTPLHSRLPDGDVCGFYSTTSDRMAYGCYPEGRDRDRIGHAFVFIDAMSRHASMNDVHLAVLINDESPDVPVRTSDMFLDRVLQEEAARRKVALEELADEQLALAWKDRARWEPQIRLLDRIGEIYGTFSPRALAELKAQLDSLEALSKELATYQDRWKLALDDLRKENLDRFLDQSAAWKERLEPKKVEILDPATKRSTLAELLPALLEFSKGRADVWKRLQDLKATEADANSAKYRTDIRLAALLRMKVILIRVAGIQLLMDAGSARLIEMRTALAELESCEASRIGVLDAARELPPLKEAPEPLAPFDEDLATVQRALPSWLGVRFRPIPDAQLEALKATRGSVSIEQVYPDGPAKEAGMQTGDILLGPPGAHFTEPNQIREWTMTSPRDTPLELDLLREGQPVKVTVSLDPYPSKLPDMPEPPKAGDAAPELSSITMVRGSLPPGPGARVPGRDILPRRRRDSRGSRCRPGPPCSAGSAPQAAPSAQAAAETAGAGGGSRPAGYGRAGGGSAGRAPRSAGAIRITGARGTGARRRRGPVDAAPHALLLGDLVRPLQERTARAPGLEQADQHPGARRERRGRPDHQQVPRLVDRPVPRARGERRAAEEPRRLRRQRNADLRAGGRKGEDRVAAGRLLAEGPSFDPRLVLVAARQLERRDLAGETDAAAAGRSRIIRARRGAGFFARQASMAARTWGIASRAAAIPAASVSFLREKSNEPTSPTFGAITTSACARLARPIFRAMISTVWSITPRALVG